MESGTRFYRDTWAEINLDYIAENVRKTKQLVGKDVAIMAVVKANAYGHGDVQVARTALQSGATHLAVAFLDEGIALRKKGITAPILVLGATRPEDVRVSVQFHLTLTVFQADWLRQAQEKLQREDKLFVHIKVDTGMGRIGIRTEAELMALEKILMEDSRFVLDGIFTHFAVADEINTDYFQEQITRFRTFLSMLKKQPKWVHCSNSAATLRFPEARYHLIRLGISMYGLTPSTEISDKLPFPLKEAFSLYTKIVHVKKIHKHEKVSYGATYEAKEDEEWIGTLPIGYADGWIRKLQGIEVLCSGKRVPVIGRVCMDQCMVKLPHPVPIGTRITLIGRDGEEVISINDIAEKLETINYEVVCMMSQRIPRIYKEKGRIVDIVNGLQ
ncbi:alanine racemase [Bacillaceae bacterium Marseille-Q3522]|nr:alanine racemase [Bacillaceae bacterium Marseille-Q3522]